MEICPAGLFVREDDTQVPDFVRENDCIVCGHCVAICPETAITHVDFPEGSVITVNREILPPVEGILEYMKTRRSVREFKDKPVERNLIEQIIEGARFAPSAHNSQCTEYIVIHNKNVLQEIVEATVLYFDKISKQLRNPVTRTLLRMAVGPQVDKAVKSVPSFEKLVTAFNNGEDRILRNAPLLIVFHSKRSALLANVNVSLALQNASLVCHGLGLGSFYTGYLIGACQRERKVQEILKIPERNQIYGALAIGWPKYKYKKWMERKPARIVWV